MHGAFSLKKIKNDKNHIVNAFFDRGVILENILRQKSFKDFFIFYLFKSAWENLSKRRRI